MELFSQKTEAMHVEFNEIAEAIVTSSYSAAVDF